MCATAAICRRFRLKSLVSSCQLVSQNMPADADATAPSVGDKKPDPEKDAICAVFYAFLPGDVPAFEDAAARRLEYTTGIVGVRSATMDPARLRDHPLAVVDNELDLLNRVIDIVLELDPDILCAWELQVASWNYLRQRADTYGASPLSIAITSFVMLKHTQVWTSWTWLGALQWHEVASRAAKSTKQRTRPLFASQVGTSSTSGGSCVQI